MSAPIRRVEPEVAWRVTRSTLGRMACVYGDPTRDDHDHAVCVRDDEAYAADLLLGLVASAVKGDETLVLDRLTDLTETLHGT